MVPMLMNKNVFDPSYKDFKIHDLKPQLLLQKTYIYKCSFMNSISNIQIAKPPWKLCG